MITNYKIKITSIFILAAIIWVNASCNRYGMYTDKRKPMIHFVNGTEGQLTVRTFTMQADLYEGKWLHVPIDKIDYSQPIVAYRRQEPDKVFYNHKFKKPILSDTTIIIGNPDFLTEIIVYTDSFPDTTNNHILYHFETNYDTFHYLKIYDLKNNLLSEELVVPKYLYQDRKPKSKYRVLPIGIARYYQKDKVRMDTIKFKGLENLPIRFKNNTYRNYPH